MLPGSILAGAVLLAGVILLTFRWEIAGGNGVAYRLDRWSGSVVQCRVDLYHRDYDPIKTREMKCDPE